MTAVRSFRDLWVWQSAMDLAAAIYELTGSFPQSETFGLSSQIQRAAASVAANIAEGHARRNLHEYLHFLSIARGSLAEVETYLELVVRLAYASPERVQQLLDLAASVSRQLVALRDSLNPRLQEDTPSYDPITP